jgi:uncharacterized membrane protein YoaK (UPF0700 family)
MVPVLPRWAWLWALCLPAAAGAVNVVALMALRHGGVTHLTGVATEGAIGLGTGDTAVLAHAALVITLYAMGCATSGWASRSPRWVPTRTAAALVGGESVVIAAAAGLGTTNLMAALGLCAFAVGLQNGLTSVVSGALLRTSHLTGMFTDLGVAAGQRLGGTVLDRRRVVVCAVVIGGFVTGGVMAAAAYRIFGILTLLASSALSAVVAVATLVLARSHLARAAQ